MRKMLLVALCGLMIVSCTGCGTRDLINGYKTVDIPYGINNMVEIGNSLYYDSQTKIVYWYSSVASNYTGDIIPSPYYAPNGKPYFYDVETGEFVTIQE